MGKQCYIPLIIFYVLLISTPILWGQNVGTIDSLKKVNLVEKDQKTVVINYADIANEFMHLSVDSAKYYTNLSLQLANKISYKKGQAEAHFLNSYVFDLVSDYPKSIASLEKAIQTFIEVGDSSYLSGCYNNLGVLYSYGTNQKKSLEYFIKAIKIGEELRDSFSLAEAYCNVAEFYEELKEYSSALKYFDKALEVDLLHNEPEEIAISHLDVGYINTKLHRYANALYHLEEAQKLMSNVKDSYYQIILFQRLANYYTETEEFNLANSYIKKAQQLHKTTNYPVLIAETLAIKGEILLKQKKYKESLWAIDSAIAQNIRINTNSNLSALYKNQTDVYFGLGWHQKAFKSMQLAKQAEDSLKAYEIAESLGAFEREEALKKERAEFKLEQELINKKDENALYKVRSKLYFTIYLAILLGVILMVGLYLYLLKQNHNKSLESNFELINHQKELIEKSYLELKENEKRLAELNATKDKFFSIIAHDLKNPFNTLIGISELMISNPEIKDTADFEELLQGMFQTAQSGHDLLENLLEWSRSQIGSIQHEPSLVSLDEIFASTTAFFSETAKTKNITIRVPDNIRQVVYADYNMVNFIFRNIVNNAIKFSHPGSDIGVLACEKEKVTVISVKDQGIGMSQETIDKLFKIEYSIQKDGTANEKGTGLGLILCKEFIEKNDGEILVESVPNQGSTFSFSLPKNANSHIF